MSFQRFQEIINKAEICGSGRAFTILERDKNSKLREVKIVGFPDNNAIKFSFDGKQPLSSYLSAGVHQKACDAVVLANYKGKSYLIFIEMKSQSVDRAKIEKQFTSSLCFMDYCDSILKEFFQENLIGICEKRFVVFYREPPIPKTPTRLNATCRASMHSQPDKPRFIAYSKPVYLKKIL